MGCVRDFVGLAGPSSKAYLLPSGGQRLTLDHFFVANAQLLLLPRASLYRRERGGDAMTTAHAHQSTDAARPSEDFNLGILINATLQICETSPQRQQSSH